MKIACNTNGRAWMIDQSGNAITVDYHPYYRDGDFIDSALFLYAYSDVSWMDVFVKYYLAYSLVNFSDEDISDLSEDITASILMDAVNKANQHHSAGDWCPSESVYRSMIDSFVNEYDASMFCTRDEAVRIVNNYKSKDWTIVGHDINQLYLRARLGGEYNSKPGNKSIYFRIGSVGFDWSNIIYFFVNDNKSGIDDVTIERDAESDNDSNGLKYVYRNRKEDPYFHMPADEYLSEEHTPIIANIDRVNARSGNSPVVYYLSRGYAYSDLFATGKLNRNQISTMYDKARKMEIMYCRQL
jgi:hypothetical protein